MKQSISNTVISIALSNPPFSDVVYVMLSAQACIISAPVMSRFMARQTLSENKSEI